MTVLEVSTSAGTPPSLATSVTRYTLLGSCALTWQGNESLRQLKRTSPGTLSGLYIRISANTLTAATTYRSRKNTANGNQVVSVSSGLTGDFQDLTHTDSIAANDLIDVSVVTGSTGTTITAVAVGCQFLATTGTAQAMAFQAASNPAVSTSLRFIPFGGGSDGGLSTTETPAQYKFKTSGTVKALSVYVDNNTASNAATAVSRINTAAGNQTLSIGATTSGLFQDLVNTDAVSAGTLGCAAISIAAGGTGSCPYIFSSCEFASTNSSFIALASGITGLTQALSVTAYYPWTGFCLAPGYSTESSAQTLAQNTYTIANLAIFLRTNSVSAASTFNLRKNAGNANQTVSITASTTGYFEDVSHTDTVVATDEINYQLVTGGAGSFVQLGVLATLVSIAGRLFSVCLLNGLGTGGPFLSNPIG